MLGGSASCAGCCACILPALEQRPRLRSLRGLRCVQASVERAEGRLVARFTRPYDADFTGSADFDVIAAYHSSQSALNSQHEGKAAASLSLTGGGVTVSEDDTPKLRRVHAALMLISWGILIPLGIIMAATLRTVGPKSMWCARPELTLRRPHFTHQL